MMDSRSTSQELRSGAGSSGNSTGQQNTDYNYTRNDSDSLTVQKLARGLGWFSIGLGLAELLAPKAVAKVAGLKGDNTALLQLFGAREIASGIAIFMQGDQPTEAVWSRVAGDALDLASLGVALSSPQSEKGKVIFATVNVLAVTALDVLCAQQLSNQKNNTATGRGNSSASASRKSLMIDRSPEELYQSWHDFEKFPQFMPRIESVRMTGQNRSHWAAKGPAGTTIEWDAETIEDRPSELIAWRSLEGSDVANSGSVRFERAPGNRGTIVTVEIDYAPPGGVISAAAAKLFREDPGQSAQEALRCFKQLMEIGEVMLSDGTIYDNGLLTQRPAQPASGSPEQKPVRASKGRAAAAKA